MDSPAHGARCYYGVHISMESVELRENAGGERHRLETLVHVHVVHVCVVANVRLVANACLVANVCLVVNVCLE